MNHVMTFFNTAELKTLMTFFVVNGICFGLISFFVLLPEKFYYPVWLRKLMRSGADPKLNKFFKLSDKLDEGDLEESQKIADELLGEADATNTKDNYMIAVDLFAREGFFTQGIEIAKRYDTKFKEKMIADNGIDVIATLNNYELKNAEMHKRKQKTPVFFLVIIAVLLVIDAFLIIITAKSLTTKLLFVPGYFLIQSAILVYLLKSDPLADFYKGRRVMKNVAYYFIQLFVCVLMSPVIDYVYYNFFKN